MISGTSLLLCVCLLIFWQVGSDFGYFPKDLLEVNHNYTNEELELPTDVSFFFLLLFFVMLLFPQHSIQLLGKRMEIPAILSYLLLVSSYICAHICWVTKCLSQVRMWMDV